MTNAIASQVNVAKSEAFWDTNRLQRLKFNSDDPDSLKAAAQEFSALMFQMMIKSMRDAETSLKSNMFASEATKHYQDMMDQQWAVHMAHTEKNGVVDTVIKQFAKNMSSIEETKLETSDLLVNNSYVFGAAKLDETKQNIATPLVPILQDLIAEKPAAIKVAAASEATVKWQEFTSPDDFVNKLLPAAINVAKTIGIDPKLLLAQAALETGWGAKIAKLPNGECSHNLFGIKASHDWEGGKVATKTTEYTNGILERKIDWFRSYTGFEDSMRDYVKLIGGSARYNASRANVQTPEMYTQALQDAGYATDPNYANKILQIYKGM